MDKSTETKREATDENKSFVPTDDMRPRDGDGYYIRGNLLPQCMTFKDENGEEHRIFLDVGTHATANQYTIDENWNELKKFPKWVGQLHDYSNWDFENNKFKDENVV